MCSVEFYPKYTENGKVIPYGTVENKCMDKQDKYQGECNLFTSIPDCKTFRCKSKQASTSVHD